MAASAPFTKTGPEPCGWPPDRACTRSTQKTFTRYTEVHGLPTVDIMGILEDSGGRLWVSTKRVIPVRSSDETFRNYDVSDGLLSDAFSRSCFQQGQNGEMLFCGSDGITAFFPENVRDNPYVPPVQITSFKILNKPVPIGADSALRKRSHTPMP